MAGWVTRQLGGEASGDYNSDGTPYVPEPTTNDNTNVLAVLKAVISPLEARQWGRVYSPYAPKDAKFECGACGKFLLSDDDYYKTPHHDWCMLAHLIKIGKQLTKNSIRYHQ